MALGVLLEWNSWLVIYVCVCVCVCVGGSILERISVNVLFKRPYCLSLTSSILNLHFVPFRICKTISCCNTDFLIWQNTLGNSL